METAPQTPTSGLPKAYEPQQTETNIYALWEASGFFNPDNLAPDGEPFTIVLPPPNATGTLHIGHASMLALQDLMIRYHRMKGRKTLWLPGTDHAAIATQNKVEKIMTTENLTRQGLGREAFLARVNEFVETSRDTIRHQIRKMGSSCDWSRECYTLDEPRSYAVRELFIRMYADKLIYRGNRIVNWCPRDTSTLADDEVDHKEIAGKLYFIKYAIKGSDEIIIVATTRPETLPGDVAIAVNPADERYKHLIGGVALLPLDGREVPIIADDYVDPAFGTGALKITPAHDANDFTIGEKYHLPVIAVINDVGAITLDGLKQHNITTTQLEQYAGLDRAVAREQIIADLMQAGKVEKIEDYTHSVGICYRCKTMIEPLISLQWFVDVNKKIPGRDASLKELAHAAVSSEAIQIIPNRFNNTYFKWIDNLRDWCISRQIWFGHRIPVYYCEKTNNGCGEIIVAHETPAKCPHCGNTTLRHDEDTLDTWFSSGMWTFSTLGWPHAMEIQKDGTT